MIPEWVVREMKTVLKLEAIPIWYETLIPIIGKTPEQLVQEEQEETLRTVIKSYKEPVY